MLKATEGVPHSIYFTSAITHDHVMLKKLTLLNGSFIAMDRAYIYYRVFEQFTQDGVFYVTKMKKNQRFKELKQNFPLKYFLGESINAIQTQIWVALIANLLLSVVKKWVKRDWSFSNQGCHDTPDTDVLYRPVSILRNPRKCVAKNHRSI